MTPPTVEDRADANIQRFLREHEDCHLYLEKEQVAPAASANVARYVADHEDCHLYVVDDEPPAR